MELQQHGYGHYHGITAGTDLTGGGTTGAVTLNVDTTKVVTGVIAGTGLTGGGNGGVPTLNLDTSKVPLLASNNWFTGSNLFFGNQSFLGSSFAHMNVGDAGCGGGFPSAIGFNVALANCNNYSLAGDGANTYINRPAGGTLYFREGNGNSMTLSPGGNMQLTGQITSYNGTPTYGNGVPMVVYTYAEPNRAWNLNPPHKAWNGVP